MALVLTLKLQQDWDKSQTIIRMPRRAMPRWAKRRCVVEVVIDDDGTLHVVPSLKTHPTAARPLKRNQGKGRPW